MNWTAIIIAGMICVTVLALYYMAENGGGNK